MLDRASDRIGVKQYSYRTEETYVQLRFAEDN
jgi:hypothetical protein